MAPSLAAVLSDISLEDMDRDVFARSTALKEGAWIAERVQRSVRETTFLLDLTSYIFYYFPKRSKLRSTCICFAVELMTSLQ